MGSEAEIRLLAPFKLKRAVASTQGRKGAKTQGFGFLGSLIRWESDSSPLFRPISRPFASLPLGVFAVTAFWGKGGCRRFHGFRRSRVAGPSCCRSLPVPNG